jgi:predicted Rossmann fold flavoprotein
MNQVVIVGGGAAGFYCSIRIKELNPHLQVVLLEKTNKTLSKLRVSGGGRCNITHNCFDYSLLSTHYPRGAKFLKKAFRKFGAKEFVDWIQSHGIELKTESDGRMFPVTDNSETIAGFYENYARKLGIEVLKGSSVKGIEQKENVFQINITDQSNLKAKYLVLATGGASDPSKISWLQNLNIQWIDTSPSLFTFNASKELMSSLSALSGISVPNAKIKFVGQKDEFTGPLLITHWGISGPAVLKASAWMSRFLKERNYQHEILISWIGEVKEEEAKQKLADFFSLHSKKKIENAVPFEIPSRLWNFLLTQSQIDTQVTVQSLNNKNFNRLIENLIRLPYQINGKTTFKEEFVTAGGIDLSQLNDETCEFKNIPSLYACGEILDIDGITGGFNFQGAWTTAELVATGITSKENRLR